MRNVAGLAQTEAQKSSDLFMKCRYMDELTDNHGMGVPETEIAFIHDAKTEAQKAALFTNVRAGNVRILLGSTAKMGAGTNVQKRLIAEHHLDIPWRPSDIEQREGRILRQGNENKRVDIFRYVTENTFDSYMWQTIPLGCQGQ